MKKLKKKNKNLKEAPDADSNYSKMMNKKKAADDDAFQEDGESLQKRLGIEDPGYQRGDNRVGDNHWTLTQILKNMLDEIKAKKKK